MSTAKLFSNLQTQAQVQSQVFSTLRISNERDTDTIWCYMNAHKDSNKTRPCFSRQALTDIENFHTLCAEVIQQTQLEKPGDPITHVVLASDGPVFNLGGDLELFAQLIRARDRRALYAYAARCIEGILKFHHAESPWMHSVALVQGDALGGGFEAALCCDTIVAEEGIGMGFPEVLFDLFPGMGAYSFLSRRISPKLAERMMLDGHVYDSAELHRLGVIDVLVRKGEGEEAVRDLIRKQRRIPNARRAMHTVRGLVNPITREELMAVTEVWVDTALRLGDRDLATMERLVRAQQKRFVATDDKQFNRAS
jgi:DSF synthase